MVVRVQGVKDTGTQQDRRVRRLPARKEVSTVHYAPIRLWRASTPAFGVSDQESGEPAAKGMKRSHPFCPLNSLRRGVRPWRWTRSVVHFRSSPCPALPVPHEPNKSRRRTTMVLRQVHGVPGNGHTSSSWPSLDSASPIALQKAVPAGTPADSGQTTRVPS